MKIDLYNNYQQFRKEQSQDWAIQRWCLRKGIRPNDILSHPQIRDIRFLLDIKEEFAAELKQNKHYAAIWGAYWNVVYINKKPLKPKAFIKFEMIAEACLEFRTQHQLKIQTIQQIRQLETGTSQKQNKDVHNKANPSCLPELTNTKREQQECHAVPTAADLPWW